MALGPTAPGKTSVPTRVPRWWETIAAQQPSGNPLDWTNTAVQGAPRGNSGVYPAFPNGPPFYPGVPTGVQQPTGISAVIPPKISGVTKWNPPTVLPGGAPSATAQAPPNYGDPNHFPGGGFTTTAKPAPDPAATRQPQSTTLPINLIDPNQFQTDPNALAKLTKAVAAAMQIPYGKLSKRAAAQARAEIAQNVAELVQQQQQVRAQGAGLAANYMAGAKAAASLSAALPDILRQNYDTAAKTLGGLAGGYAGDIQSIAQGQANQIAGNPAVGGGAPVTSTGENVASGGENSIAAAMRNALYGNTMAFTGSPSSPGVGLVGATPGLIAQAASLPQLLLGQGTQSGLLARGTANLEAQKLLPDIRAQQAKLPTLTSQYYNSLVSDYQKTGQLTADRLIKLAGMFNLTPYQADQLMLNANRFNMQTQLGVGKQNAAAQAAALKADAPHWTTYQDANGIEHAADLNHPGVAFALPGAGKAAAGAKLMTAGEQNTAWKDFDGWLNHQRHGTYTTQTSAGQTQHVVSSAPQSAQAAWKNAVTRYRGLIRSDPQALTTMLQAFMDAYGGNYTINKQGMLVNLPYGTPGSVRGVTSTDPNDPGAVTWTPPLEPAVVATG